MQCELIPIHQFLTRDLQNYVLDPDTLKYFKIHYEDYLYKLDQSLLNNENEEHQKNLLNHFLKTTFIEYENINTFHRIDSVIKDADNYPRVLIEVKRINNQTEMISEGDLNRKAFHEALFYFFTLRKQSDSFRLNYVMITNCESIYLFTARQFDELCKNQKIADCLKTYYDKESSLVEKTENLYKELTKIFHDERGQNSQKIQIKMACIHLRECQDEQQLELLYKFLSPYTLFNQPLSNDGNHLNERFYYELLHIIGLKEKTNSKGLEYNQDKSSMIGCTIETLKFRYKYNDEQAYHTAFELNILWLNRILFLKILEAQLLAYSDGQFKKFLDEHKICHLSNLATLFFRVLAVQREERPDMEAQFPNMPYLNSSLFEETELERILSIDQVTMLHPMAIYKNTILKEKNVTLPFLSYLIRFLNCYQFNKDSEFTDKNTVISSAVLGLVFEKLNGYQDGSHFTPARITMHMARHTIRQLLLQKFNAAFRKNYQNFEQLQNYVKKLDAEDEEGKQAKQIVDSIRIFDPAVGSGHFLVSCLNELVKIKSDLRLTDDWYAYHTDVQNDELIITISEGHPFHYTLQNGEMNRVQQTIQKSLFNTKLRIIENQLYGIDINPNSVNICRLRLWIELLKHTYYVDAHYINLHILPNLEFKVMTANSLVRLEKGDVIDAQYFDVLDELRKSFNAYFEAGAENKQTLRNNIQQSLDTVKQLRIGTEEQKEKLVDAFDPFNLSVSNPFFDSVLMFGVSKFDIVIGNPPYIQLQSIPKNQNPYLKQEFKTYKSTGDIYQLFIERAFNWLTEDGVVSFIVSNKWMRAGYGQSTRAWLYDNAVVDELIDLGAGQFASATVDTNIIRYHKKLSESNQTEIAAGHSLDKPANGIINTNGDGDSWIIIDCEETKILDKMRLNGTPLKDWDVQINRGILTGYNEAFIIDQAQYDALVAEDPKSKEILKPMLRGRDIRRWGCNWAGLYLIATHNGEKSKNIPPLNIDDYPAVKAYLNTHWEKIEKRQDQGDTPYNLRNCAYWEEFEKPKIVWARMMREHKSNRTRFPRFGYTDAFFYTDDSCVIVSGNDLKYILAFLNSHCMNYIIHKRVTSFDDKGFAMRQQFIQEFPIPKDKISDQDYKRLVSLVDELITVSGHDQAVSDLEQEIDQIVYGLYGFTDEEIEVIEAKVES